MKIALSLSGGALRASAHIGAIRYLEDIGVEISAVSGSSAGAILALFLASGKSSYEIEEFLFSIKKRELFKFKGSPALFSLDRLENRLREYLDIKSFSDLKIPVHITLTRLNDAKTIYVSEGDAIKTAIASSALIPIFTPVKIGDYYYCDGGFGDNLPTKVLLEYRYKIVSINVNPLKEDYPPTLLDMFKLSKIISMQCNIAQGKEYSDLHLDVQGVEGMGLFDFKKVKRAIESGYQEMKNLWLNRDLEVL